MIRAIFLAFVLSSAALAQTPGMGETRPSAPNPRDGAAPADGVVKDLPKERAPADVGKPQPDSDRAATRCQELFGSERKDCLRQERNAGTGSTRPAEPATAPPPQNPR